MPWSDFWRRHHRALATIAAGALAAGASLLGDSGLNPVDGFLYDLSLAAADRRPGGSGEPVAVVALDRESLEADELAALPRALLSPVWAKLLNGLTESGAKAVGFDIIFEYSANRIPGGDGRYDREFLVALGRAHDRVVLGRAAKAGPAPPFAAVAFDGGASVELLLDPDGVQRRMMARFRTETGEALPTLAAALLYRAKQPPMPPVVRLAPAAPLEAIPTYRLIDVIRCADKNALREVFAGKIVLVGTNLAEEDRKRTPDRFMPEPQARAQKIGDCRLDRLGASDPGGGTAPGVFVHAAAIQHVLTGNLVQPLPKSAQAAAAALAAGAGAVLGFLTSPGLAALGIVLIGGVAFAAALLLLGIGWWFPIALPLGAAVAAAVMAYVTRFLAEERRRRRVQHAFSHYLAPAIVDQLADSETELRLGGERRDVTVMFADLSGFTALSGRVGPGRVDECDQ